jgi:hypothetical protein
MKWKCELCGADGEYTPDDDTPMRRVYYDIHLLHQGASPKCVSGNNTVMHLLLIDLFAVIRLCN